MLFEIFFSATFDLKHKSVLHCGRPSFKHLLKKGLEPTCCIMGMLSKVLGFPQSRTTNNCPFAFSLFRAFFPPHFQFGCQIEYRSSALPLNQI